MKKKSLSGLVIILGVIGLLSLLLEWSSNQEALKSLKAPIVRSSFSPKAEPTTAIERDEYFFSILRDPHINRIPEGIRTAELAKYQLLPKAQLKSFGGSEYKWSEAGPNDVGGRTRALAIDNRNSDVIFAGGVSGGIWKSIDKGQSWQLKNSPNETFSVTSICQDPREGYQDTWYYCSGEWNGNSARAVGASYYGHGVYKSIDNGDNWEPIIGHTSSQYKWDDLMDFVSKVKVDPINGSLLLATNGHGLMIATEEDGTYEAGILLGGANDHYYCDFDIDTNGNYLVVLSEYGYNSYWAEPNVAPVTKPGVYFLDRSIEPSSFVQIDTESTTFPSTYERSLIRFAPSNTTVGYIFTHKENYEVAFHKIDVLENLLIDRTANLPNYSDNGKLGPQGNYNMTLAVKPDDENFVIAGSTCLFRSFDGFATTPAQEVGWIGGYSLSGSGSYPNHHPDCHISVFDINNPDALWSGHDGGLSYVSDITQNTSAEINMAWQDMNNGYNVTQFYTVANIVKANDDRYLGGTQDNGSPYFRFNASTGASVDISSGDGSYCYLANDYVYISTQNGRVMRTQYKENGDIYNPYGDTDYFWASVHPSEATGQLFINPFAVNSNNENVMYYAGGSDLWINAEIESIENFTYETMQGWSAPEGLKVTGATITAMAVSKQPANVLYYAAYSGGSMPLLYKVTNSTDVSNLVRSDISIDAAAIGSYPYYIAINPQNADELIVVFSNYGVPSIFHSIDGGSNFINVDGNLEATYAVPGPSIRSAAILNWSGEKTFFVSTSIGVYKTNILNGASTVWTNVAHEQLGNVVCNRIKTSDLDGKIVVATHGRGLFVGKDNQVYVNEALPNLNRLTTSPDDVIDLSNLFGHKTSGEVNISMIGNSNPSVVSSSINNTHLTLDYSDTNEGQSIITLEGSSNGDVQSTSFTVAVTIDLTTNIEESTAQIIPILYPNPTIGQFKIKTSGLNLNNCSVHIFNTKGQEILTKSFNTTDQLLNYSFNLRGKTKGVYIVRIMNDTNDFTQKIRLQ